MKFQINMASPVRGFISGLKMSAAIYRVSANLVDLAVRGVEAITDDAAIAALAGHLADATAPLEGVAPHAGDRAQRAARIERDLRKEIHGDTQVDASAACPGRSRSARRRAAKARAKAQVAQAVQVAQAWD